MKPTLEQVDDAIETWHNRVTCDWVELHDYLGWSWQEYQAWVRDPDCIPDRPLGSH